MLVFIAGVDGYIGWALAKHLLGLGHEVRGCDNFSRRQRVKRVGSDSAIPIDDPQARHKEVKFAEYDVRDNHIVELLKQAKPDAVVHLGEQPSAPYSMIGPKEAIETQTTNVMGTLQLLYAMREVCPDAHLVKLGTMGEYGTPNIDIPEGFFEIEYRGRKDRLPFPRQAGSWYHQSKVHDSNNIMFACKLWGLSCTDIMQGVVYGTRTQSHDDGPVTRFDIDECFGTAINRFCAQAVIGHPLTMYGEGLQQRGFLPLRDSIQCLTLALTHPPAKGEYRVFNQFEEVYRIVELARLVKDVAIAMGMRTEIVKIPNPRLEASDHYYKPDHQHLLDLGYEPTRNMAIELYKVLEDLWPHRDRINQMKDVLMPKIQWSG